MSRSSGNPHCNRPPFSCIFLCRTISTPKFPLFYSKNQGSVNTRFKRKELSARSMAERNRRSSRRLERSSAKDSEASSNFNSWTVVKLRQELKRRGCSSTGLKAELVMIYFPDTFIFRLLNWLLSCCTVASFS